MPWLCDLTVLQKCKCAWTLACGGTTVHRLLQGSVRRGVFMAGAQTGAAVISSFPSVCGSVCYLMPEVHISVDGHG